ncbi:MAG: helix-turn-helix domain-containing protein [Nanoarchaeota archaeon]
MMNKEKSSFQEFMGDSPMMKILDYLLTERELDFSITDMANNSGIGRATLYRMWNSLIQNQIIVPTRIIGKAKLFKLNMRNEKINKLIEIYDLLTLDELKKRAEKEKIKVIA